MKIILAIAAIISVAVAHECDSRQDCVEFQTCCMNVCDQNLKSLDCKAWTRSDGTKYVTGTCECFDTPASCDLQMVRSSDPIVDQSSIDVNLYRQQVLYAHNHYRRKHQAPTMTLDEDLNTGAQAWANELPTALQPHSPPEDRVGAGENVHVAGRMPTGADTTCSWYSEIAKYKFSNPGFHGDTGHFTQVVWKDSTKLGVGIRYDRSKEKIYTVARYSPPGNYNGAENYRANVLPIQS